MTRTANFAAYTPYLLPTTGGGTTLQSTGYQCSATTFGALNLADWVVEGYALVAASEPTPQNVALSPESAQLLALGMEDVRMGRVRRIDLNEFDED